MRVRVYGCISIFNLVVSMVLLLFLLQTSLVAVLMIMVVVVIDNSYD